MCNFFGIFRFIAAILQKSFRCLCPQQIFFLPFPFQFSTSTPRIPFKIQDDLEIHCEPHQTLRTDPPCGFLLDHEEALRATLWATATSGNEVTLRGSKAITLWAITKEVAMSGKEVTLRGIKTEVSVHREETSRLEAGTGNTLRH